MKFKTTKKGSYLLALTACALLAVAALTVQGSANAQTVPIQLLINWEADTYVPEGFPGKALATSDSRITIGVDLINLGRRVALSNYKVFWYIDDRFYQGATGLSQITLAAPHFIGNTSIRVRVVITDYPSAPGRTMTIPVVVPEAVIQSSAPSLAAAAAPFSLQAYPFYFNISDPSQLNYNWGLNGVNAGNQNPFTATREMAEQRNSRVELSISNPARLVERITRELTIFR